MWRCRGQGSPQPIRGDEGDEVLHEASARQACEAERVLSDWAKVARNAVLAA